MPEQASPAIEWTPRRLRAGFGRAESCNGCGEGGFPAWIGRALLTAHADGGWYCDRCSHVLERLGNATQPAD